MEPLSATARLTLRPILDGQPATAAKVAFAWTIAAGPALARATHAMHGGPTACFVVRARTEAWRQGTAARASACSPNASPIFSAPTTVKQFVIEQQE